MSKVLDQLRHRQADYIKQLDYLPKLCMVSLLKECYYGSLGKVLSGDGKQIGNLVFKTDVHNDSVEVEIYIQHPEDWTRKFVIRHFTETSGRSTTYHVKSQYGKWDKPLGEAVEIIRQGQIKYVQDKLADVDKQISDLLGELNKEKSEFESLFD
jgi:hypothetical protein